MPFAFLETEYLTRRAAEHGHGPIHEAETSLKDLITPNRPLRYCGYLVLMGMWVLMMIIIWSAAGARYLPSPIDVANTFQGLWNDDSLGAQIWTSMALNLEAVFLTFSVSLLIAYATVLPVFRPFATLVASGRYNGMIGLPLVFLSILHNPHSVKIALLMFGAGVFAVESFTQMIKSIPKELYEHSRTLRMSGWRVTWEVVVLGTFDQALDIIRVGAAMIWMLLPMVEGYFPVRGRHRHVDVFCIMFVVLAIGFVQDMVIGYLRALVCPYRELEEKR